MSNTPDISVVLISHEHEEDLPACLRSLSVAMDRVSAELIFIDNRSRDDSFRIAERLSPRPRRLLRNEKRKGFAANANAGIEQARGEQVLLLNPDTVVEPDAISMLSRYLKQNPPVAVVAPSLYFPDGSLQPSRRRFPTWRSFLARRTPLRRWLRGGAADRRHLMAEADPHSAQTIDWALAACWLTRRSALQEVGGFDEGYPLYVEDIDLCLRLHQAGWRIDYLPDARIVHHHHAVTDTRWLTWRTLAHLRGMGRYVCKHGLTAHRKSRLEGGGR